MTRRAKGAAAAAAPTRLQALPPPDPALLREILPELSPVDLWRGVVPVAFGAHRYELAALSMEEDERWIASLDGGMRGLLEGVRAGEDDPSALMAVLMTASDKLLDAVIAYDRDGVLPERAELKRQGRAIDALRAAMAVWVATNPTLAAAVLALQAAPAKEPPTNGKPADGSPPPSSSSRARTAGRRARRARS